MKNCKRFAKLLAIALLATTTNAMPQSYVGSWKAKENVKWEYNGIEINDNSIYLGYNFSIGEIALGVDAIHGSKANFYNLTTGKSYIQKIPMIHILDAVEYKGYIYFVGGFKDGRSAFVKYDEKTGKTETIDIPYPTHNNCNRHYLILEHNGKLYIENSHGNISTYFAVYDIKTGEWSKHTMRFFSIHGVGEEIITTKGEIEWIQ